jgi:hypothetical protein
VTYDIGFPVKAVDLANSLPSLEGRIPLSGFHTSVNGQEVTFQQNNASGEPDVLAWYMKRVTFQRRMLTNISIAYSSEYGDEGGFGSRVASYFYGSGWIWKGPIGQLDVTVVNLSKYEVWRIENSNERTPKPQAFMVDDLSTAVRYPSVEPDKNATIDVFMGPLDSIAMFEGIKTKEEVVKRDQLFFDTPFQLYVWQNMIYAANGLIFDDARLDEFFRKQPWYKPEQENVDALLNDREKESLQNIRSLQEARALGSRTR